MDRVKKEHSRRRRRTRRLKRLWALGEGGGEHQAGEEGGRARPGQAARAGAQGLRLRWRTPGEERSTLLSHSLASDLFSRGGALQAAAAGREKEEAEGSARGGARDARTVDRAAIRRSDARLPRKGAGLGRGKAAPMGKKGLKDALAARLGLPSQRVGRGGWHHPLLALERSGGGEKREKRRRGAFV